MLEERRSDIARLLEENRSFATGTIIASALAAAVIAYMLRRARQEEERMPAAMATGAWGRARDLVGEERLEAGRDFVMERLLPEFKPTLLAILRDFQDLTEQWFRQTEKAIKRL
ncbi:MAG: hypothetical protein HY690_10180 [Chloroflexi bacterium]|nr:hypothetical protein [Chloroflexota bacterium]